MVGHHAVFRSWAASVALPPFCSSLGLSATFSHTTPAMMMLSQKMRVKVTGSSKKKAEAMTAPTAPMPTQTA